MQSTSLDVVKEICCGQIANRGASCYNALYMLMCTEIKTQDILQEKAVCVCKICKNHELVRKVNTYEFVSGVTVLQDFIVKPKTKHHLCRCALKSTSMHSH